MVTVTAPAAPLTYAQLVRLREKLDDHNRYELIDGELEVTPAPAPRHQWVAGHLFFVLMGHVLERGLGQLFFAPLDVILTDQDVVEPDIVYLTAEQLARVTERGVEEPPTLVVEILSPSTSRRDRTRKRELYERQGVPHCWLVDPKRCTLEEYKLRHGRYELVASLAGDAEVQPAHFPGLVIRLADVWPPAGWRAGRSASRAAKRLASINVSPRRERQDDDRTSRRIKLENYTLFTDAQPHAWLPVKWAYVSTAR
jgi:Uma2 family endonuclease